MLSGMLPFSFRVGESQIDVFDAVILDHLQNLRYAVVTTSGLLRHAQSPFSTMQFGSRTMRRPMFS
jgi:hypothetical protein